MLFPPWPAAGVLENLQKQIAALLFGKVLKLF
jgi:hypothetical protein